MSRSPSSTGSGESVFVSERSAAGPTVVSALAELFAALGSLTSDRTLAWFVICPVACGRTFKSTVASWPLVTVPSAQVTVPDACWQMPCEGVAESNVTFAGNVSSIWMPVAFEGPALWTVSV